MRGVERLILLDARVGAQRLEQREPSRGPAAKQIATARLTSTTGEGAIRVSAS